MDNGDQGCCCMGSTNRFHEQLFQDHDLDMEDGVANATSTMLVLYKTNSNEVYAQLEKCRINPNLMTKNRQDLEYYIPQLINYLVFKNNSDQLTDFLFYASQQDYFFAHLVYFCLYSLSGYGAKKLIILQEVVIFLDSFQTEMQKQFHTQMLITSKDPIPIGPNLGMIQHYGTGDCDEIHRIKYNEISLRQYTSIYKDPLGKENNLGFNSTLDFWADLITISERLHMADPQIISLKADVQRINQRLPSAVYVPFVSDSIRNYIVLNIVPSECKVFSTKERSPFYLCFELYRPDIETQDQENADKRLSFAKTVLRSSNLGRLSRIKSILETDDNIVDHKTSIHPLQTIDEDAASENPTSMFYVNQDSDYQSFIQDDSEPFVSLENTFEQSQVRKSISGSRPTSYLFGETSKEQEDRLRRQSPFGGLKSWRLVHLIVKSGDNLKQEQLAMQILSCIDQIFQIEKLPIKLVTYEVLSLGPSCGIIEMVKDAITIDSLKRSLFADQKSLKEFFDANFGEREKENFLNTLVGYSLACYIMQLKDRHNGNILLKKNGQLVHIDFGFFLGNAPGRGIEFESKVPFKLLNEQIEVLGGIESPMFERFRRLFYDGFQALRKHNERILLIVKMMYSGHGTTMPCFRKGQKSIIQLQERFYLDEQSDAEINVICQKYTIIICQYNQLINGQLESKMV